MLQQNNIIFSGLLACVSLYAIEIPTWKAPESILYEKYCIEEVEAAHQDEEAPGSSIQVISEPDHLPKLNPGYYHVGSCLNPFVESRETLYHNSFSNAISSTIAIQRSSGRKPENLLRWVLLKAVWKDFMVRGSLDTPFRCRIFDDFRKL